MGRCKYTHCTYIHTVHTYIHTYTQSEIALYMERKEGQQYTLSQERKRDRERKLFGWWEIYLSPYYFAVMQCQPKILLLLPLSLSV